MGRVPVVHGAKRLVHVAEHIVQAVPGAELDGSACVDLKEEQPCIADKCSMNSFLSKLIYVFSSI